MIPSIDPRPTSTKKKKQKTKGLTESMFWIFAQEICDNILNSGAFLDLSVTNQPEKIRNI